MDKTPVADRNPYVPPRGALEGGSVRKVNFDSPAMLAMVGALCSVFSAFPIAGGIALFFRFPVPFVGYLSGVDAIVPALLAVIFYGVFLGGFILLGALGALSGAMVARMTSNGQSNRKRMVVVFSFVITTACLVVLAILDSLIGPW